jgi:lipoprotein-anchoring transpeptidase ErfK/SrfK
MELVLPKALVLGRGDGCVLTRTGHSMRRWIFIVGLMVWQPAFAANLTPEAINAANFNGKLPHEDKTTALAVKVQVLLDRSKFSPGEIDGRFGDNVEKALLAYAEANNLPSAKALTSEIWSKLQAGAGDPVITTYVLTDRDLKGPFTEKLPSKMEEMKSLKRLNYTGPKEALSERFHMSQDLLAELNPGKKFDHAGDTINVVGLAQETSASKATHVEVDKERQTVKAFAKDGSLLAFYPASVGSDEKPTPTGTLKVKEVLANPNYRYNPKYKFSGIKSKKPFTINPGPNNPVGTMWIGLAGDDGYGIHGTGDPSRVSKSESHGCVRLTNWDVERLAKSIKKGVEVSFVEDKQSAR